MAFSEEFGGRQSPFARLLEALDADNPPYPESSFARLWPGASATSSRANFPSSDAVESLYVESLGPEPSPVKPLKNDLTANFADMRQELARPQTHAELRQLRRRCALLLHPDRVAPLDRSLAENFMAEVNAAIDRAIKGKSTVAQTP
jgi:hypothetical protein